MLDVLYMYRIYYSTVQYTIYVYKRGRRNSPSVGLMHKVHPHGEGGGSEGRKEKAKEGVNINIWEVRRAKKDGRWVRGKKGCEGLPGECIKSHRGKLPGRRKKARLSS